MNTKEIKAMKKMEAIRALLGHGYLVDIDQLAEMGLLEALVAYQLACEKANAEDIDQGGWGISYPQLELTKRQLVHKTCTGNTTFICEPRKGIVSMVRAEDAPPLNTRFGRDAILAILCGVKPAEGQIGGNPNDFGVEYLRALYGGLFEEEISKSLGAWDFVLDAPSGEEELAWGDTYAEMVFRDKTVSAPSGAWPSLATLEWVLDMCFRGNIDKEAFFLAMDGQEEGEGFFVVPKGCNRKNDKGVIYISPKVDELLISLEEALENGASLQEVPWAAN